MCGIAGYVHLDGRPLVAEVDAPILAAMGGALHHRGPDDSRTMLWENVGFVFKRLSIVDIEGGAQPLETPGGQVCAMVNGEIYNHREVRRDLAARHALRTHSDCEVVPYLYLDRDLGLCDPLNGMFAIALLDRRKRRILLARDRMGVKPLFYCVADGGRVLVFASELKGLFAHPAVPRVFDWHSALSDSLGCDAQPRERASGFLGIERVPAAGIVDVDIGRRAVNIRRYWALPPRGEPVAGKPAAWYVDGYRALLEDSVRMRLMSDVRYGMFLSGGIDSSTLAAIAARAGPFPTFTVLSRSTIGSGDAGSAREVASALGLPNHQVLFDESAIDIGPDRWRRVLWACEMHSLTAEQLFKFYLHACAKERYPDLKVMLLGQGSDEFSGGYTSLLLGRQPGTGADEWTAVGTRLHAMEAARDAATAGFVDLYVDLFGSGLLSREFAARAAGGTRTGTTWDRYVGFFRQNLDYHLWHEDRTSSAHSIENRVPFLDYRLLEFLAQVPARLHPELFVDKRILRAAAYGQLPGSLASRPKGSFFYGKEETHAFGMMYGILQRNGGELIEQALAGSESTDGPLEADGLRSYAANVGRDPSGRQVTGLLWLVNMGLLADMAVRGGPVIASAERLPVAEAQLCGTGRPIEIARVAGSPSTDAPEKLARAPVVSEPDDGEVVALAPGTVVVRSTFGDAGAGASGVYIVRNEKMEAVKSPGWAKFLLQVDGQKTLRQIVDGGRLNRSQVRRHVRAGIAEGIVEILTGRR